MSSILYVYAIGRAGHPFPPDVCSVQSGSLASFYSLVDDVEYHQAVIDTVKNVLVPGAQNADLKRLLETAVPTLEGHLQHAKMVQAQVSKK